MKPAIRLLTLLGQSAPAFDPLTDVTTGTLKFWVSHNGLFYQDTGETTPATANNDPIGAAEDQSDGGHDPIEATNKPLLKTNFIGSTSAMFFDGINDKLTTPAFDTEISTGAYTLFLAAQVGHDGTNRCLLSTADGNHIFLLGTASTIYMYGGNWRKFNFPCDSSPHVFCFRRPSAAGRTRLYVDNVLDAADDAVNVDTSEWLNTSIVIGESAGGWNFGGYDFTIGLYKDALSDEEMFAVGSVLKKALAIP